MTDRHYDAIIIGAGHNGLVCAAYLARAGLKVGMFERRDLIGGAAVTEELWPGYHLTTASYVMSLFQPKIIHDLNLMAHGFEVITAPPLVQMFEDGSHLVMHGDPAKMASELARNHPDDGEAFLRYRAHMLSLAPIIRSFMWSVPVDPTSRKPRDMLETARFGWRHRRGLSQFYEIFDLLTMSAYDYLARWFRSDRSILAIGFYAAGGGGGNVDFRTPGTAFVLSRSYLRDNTTPVGGTGFLRGGMGSIPKALASVASAAGAEIFTGAKVAGIEQEAGCAIGIRLESGETIRARTVISNANAKTTFLRLCGQGTVPEALVDATRNIRAKSTVYKIHLALNGLPDFTGFAEKGHGFDYPVQLRIADSIAEVDRSHALAELGEISNCPFLTVMTPSVLDRSLAPPGHHIMSIFGGHVPNVPEGSSWDEHRDSLLEHVIMRISRFAPAFREKIMHVQILTPLDYERIFDLPGGHLQHGEMSLDQMFFSRPAPHFARFRTHLPGLYLCGAAAHPGGGVTGIPGHNAAQVILRDLKK